MQEGPSLVLFEMFFFESSGSHLVSVKCLFSHWERTFLLQVSFAQIPEPKKEADNLKLHVSPHFEVSVQAAHKTEIQKARVGQEWAIHFSFPRGGVATAVSWHSLSPPALA